VSHMRWTYGVGCAAVAEAVAVAEVACVLIAAGPFLTIVTPAGEVVFDRCRVLHFELCLRARATFLAGFDRSILKECGGEERGRE
jgi:hypothetical protein